MARRWAACGQSRSLGKEHGSKQVMGSGTAAPEERHYRVKDLAALWSTSSTTITRMFGNEPGVIRKLGPRGLRTKLFIPESAVLRVRERLGNKPLQPLTTSLDPLSVISFGNLHTRVAKQPRHIIKLKASKKLTHGKGVAEAVGPTV